MQNAFVSACDMQIVTTCTQPLLLDTREKLATATQTNDHRAHILTYQPRFYLLHLLSLSLRLSSLSV